MAKLHFRMQRAHIFVTMMLPWIWIILDGYIRCITSTEGLIYKSSNMQSYHKVCSACPWNSQGRPNSRSWLGRRLPSIETRWTITYYRIRACAIISCVPNNEWMLIIHCKVVLSQLEAYVMPTAQIFHQLHLSAYLHYSLARLALSKQRKIENKRL